MQIEIYINSRLMATCENHDLGIKIAKDIWDAMPCSIEVWEWNRVPVPASDRQPDLTPTRIWKRFANGTEVTA